MKLYRHLSAINNNYLLALYAPVLINGLVKDLVFTRSCNVRTVKSYECSKENVRAGRF